MSHAHVAQLKTSIKITSYTIVFNLNNFSSERAHAKIQKPLIFRTFQSTPVKIIRFNLNSILQC